MIPSRLRRGVGASFVLLAACSAGEPAAGPPHPAPASRAGKAGARGGPVVVMQAGTDVVTGVAALACTQKECERDDGAAPSRFATLGGRGVVTFVTGREFSEARVVVRATGGRKVDGARLRPGTTMAYRAAVPAGRYVVALSAEWQGGKGRWVFGLRVPRG